MEVYVTKLSTLKIKKKIKTVIKNRQVLLTYTEDGVYAIHDKCPHRGSSLYSGTINNGAIFCKDHGLGISLKTGQVTDLEKAEFLKLDEYSMSVRTFKVTIRDDDIYIDI